MWLMLYEIIRLVTFSLHLFRFHFHCFIQTLIALDLSKNLMGDKAIQNLADILRNSKVNSFFYVSHFHIHFSTQTLTTLDLSTNEIVATGAQSLADALRNNTVNIFLFLSFSFPYSLIHTEPY
jgi:Ran GTPase-activating protein (RanGAP) involved in mRNA processing and transport